MEQNIRDLFDYQRFEENEKLKKLIDKTEEKYNSRLNDDALDWVSAAGEPTAEATVKDLFLTKDDDVG